MRGLIPANRREPKAARAKGYSCAASSVASSGAGSSGAKTGIPNSVCSKLSGAGAVGGLYIPGGVPTALMAEYYAQRAATGLIVNEATAISQQGTGCPNSPGIYTDEQVAGWRPVTEAVHQAGRRIFLQLWHMGRISHPSFQVNGELPVAPSAIPPRTGQVLTERGMQPYAHVIVSTEDDLRHGAVPVPLAALRKEFHGPLIIANGFTRATATQALAEDLADAVAFGRLFIANPDLPERFRLDAPLNALEEAILYGGAEKGYTDYPAMGPQLVER
jgi:2,4-dienoyl-CoA reductase-like NADH-dependent reductase (Old Yellow Enzyme family)